MDLKKEQARRQRKNETNCTSLGTDNSQPEESSGAQNGKVQKAPTTKEKDCLNASDNLPEKGQTQETGLWILGTILIVGDSMLNGVEERKMPSHIKLRNFPGSTVRDIYDYVKLLLRKRPSHVNLHVGTNDAVNSDCSTISSLTIKNTLKVLYL